MEITILTNCLRISWAVLETDLVLLPWKHFKTVLEITTSSAYTKYKSDRDRMLAGSVSARRMDASGLEIWNHFQRSGQASGSHGGAGIAVFNLW